MPRPKLKKGDITIAEVYKMSYEWYYPEKDDKERRMNLDVLSAKLIARKNFEYNRQTKTWEPTTKRHVRFEFVVTSDPISYKKTDTVKKHRYPVTFLLYNPDLLWESPFRWRTGSTKKVLFARKGSSSQERLRITNANIKNGIQIQFLMELMWVCNYWGLLFGPMTCMNKPPLKKNPSFIPFFDKHALFIIEKILNPLFKNEEFRIKLNQITRNI